MQLQQAEYEPNIIWIYVSFALQQLATTVITIITIIFKPSVQTRKNIIIIIIIIIIKNIIFLILDKYNCQEVFSR